MTVPSERDPNIAYSEDVTRVPTYGEGYRDGWDAALEAQHTRDEEARRDVVSEGARRDTEDFGRPPTPDSFEEARAIVTRLATLTAWWQKTSVDQLIARAQAWRRAYVEQSDQGEKGDAK